MKLRRLSEVRRLRRPKRLKAPSLRLSGNVFVRSFDELAAVENSLTLMSFFAYRRVELIRFFRRSFGASKWQAIVRRQCPVTPSAFVRQFVRFESPGWAFAAVELYARRLGFVSVFDEGFRRGVSHLMSEVSSVPLGTDGHFKHPQFGPTPAPLSAVWDAHPDLVGLVTSLLRRGGTRRHTKCAKMALGGTPCQPSKV